MDAGPWPVTEKCDLEIITKAFSEHFQKIDLNDYHIEEA